MAPVTAVPRSQLDVFADDDLDGPYELYREIRDTAPVVYLESIDAYAISRYDDVRRALKDWKTFPSSHGTAFNDIMNDNAVGTVLTTDPPEHGRLRALLLDRLRLSSVAELSDWVNERAAALIAPMVERRKIDVPTELAHPFPSEIVGELLGLPSEMTEKFVVGSAAVFAAMGPLNERAQTALGVIGEVLETISRMTKEDLTEGSMGYALYEAAERGDFPPETTIKLLWNYAGPAFDTTIQGINNVVWVLAHNPSELQRLAADPSLIPSACNEILRYETPVQVWGRWCESDTDVDGMTIPEGARVAVLLAAANRDERHYTDPDRFDITRNPTDLMSFGHGVHTCVGASLARLEMEAVLRALVQRVRKIDVIEAERYTNNTVRAFRRLAVELHPN